jgi:hypothetical protein
MKIPRVPLDALSSDHDAKAVRPKDFALPVWDHGTADP